MGLQNTQVVTKKSNIYYLFWLLNQLVGSLPVI